MVSFTQAALIAATQNGNRYPVVIEAVHNARTMNQQDGSTDNRLSYYRFIILWLHLLCHMSYGL